VTRTSQRWGDQVSVVSPLPLPKREDEGEGLLNCRSSSANQIAATHYRVPGKPDDSRIATQRPRAEPEILTAFDREFGLLDSHVRRRPIR